MTPLRRSPAAGHASLLVLLVLVLSQERADTSSHLRGGKAYVARKWAAWPHSLQCSSMSTKYRAWNVWWDACIQQWGSQGERGHCCPGQSVCWVAGSGAFQQRQR